jgi:hypothetical protein
MLIGGLSLKLSTVDPTDTSSALAIIRNSGMPPGVEISPIRVHLFEWSPLSLGWYESLLWGFIFSSSVMASPGSTGVWNGTAIRLFRVEALAPQAPSLTQPRGAVDALGSNIVQRIGSLNLRGAAINVSTAGRSRRTSGASASSAPVSGAVRDV